MRYQAEKEVPQPEDGSEFAAQDDGDFHNESGLFGGGTGGFRHKTQLSYTQGFLTSVS